MIVSAVPLAPEDRVRLAPANVTVADFGRRDDTLAGALADADGILVNSHVAVDAELLALAPRLSVISTISAGFDHIDLAAAFNRGITVTTTPVLSDAVADFALGLIIIAARRIGEAIASVKSGGWDVALLGSDLRGKTLFVVGFGRIGREVARRARGFKFQVLCFDVRPEIQVIDGVERVKTLAEGLARADFVSVHVDLNPSTAHLFDATAFGAMKPGAYFVNTSRGGVVDQAALARSLEDGHLAGAALDVLQDEPPNPHDPLLALPNVVVVPHIASATVETRRRMLECALDDLATCLRGEPCANALEVR